MNENDADRFDESYMGVKKQFRPDWLNNENKIFINKLNFICKNYDQTHKSVSYLLFIIVRIVDDRSDFWLIIMNSFNTIDEKLEVHSLQAAVE